MEKEGKTKGETNYFSTLQKKLKTELFFFDNVKSRQSKDSRLYSLLSLSKHTLHLYYTTHFLNMHIHT